MGQAQASEAAPERADLVWSEDDVKDAMDAHGVRDREAVLEEARLHDADGNLYLDKEELHSAAGLVAATKVAEAEAESRAASREVDGVGEQTLVSSGPGANPEYLPSHCPLKMDPSGLRNRFH